MDLPRVEDDADPYLPLRPALGWKATTRMSAEVIAIIAWAILCSCRPLIWSSALWSATSVAISLSKSRSSALSVYGVSSTVSCKIAAQTV